MKAKSKPVITIDQLYESLKYTDRKDDNLFEVAEVNEPFEELRDALPKEFNEHERLYSILINCIEQAECNAFHIEFSVAKVFCYRNRRSAV